ncbi:Serine threonine-kinase chloroplastic [Micractinium conductrix]|uniref:Serine threonine-kinase chloroplastic n=1 Tax=Micractinium conductrix TaxID=554055 RepID=A0A2P6UZ66_9CHLO|nr:Serine threonine-kinase chloroplastic [Micractinium conductrix]|eukprot:PSC67135.1 Serine threonine-kinase chloroplastic [Micractinium conductrix]
MASPASTSALRGQAPQPGAAAAGPARRPASLPGPLPQRPLPPRRTQLRPTAALAPEHVEAAATGLSQLHHLLTLAYEPIVLPCSSMNCGDITYRSSLDPVLRMEERALNPQGLALVATAAAYLFLRPGVLPGAIDTYLKAPLQRARSKVYGKEDFDMGRKLASGGFGTVYKAELVVDEEGTRREVIVKKATEFGEAEAWMNERMMRWAPKAVAEFVTAFSEGKGQLGDATWLVWAYEGDYTLADLMQKKEFPYNLEQSLFGRELNIPKGPERKAAILRVALQQLIYCLEKCHAVGIVHRDIKPQNCILSERDQCIKLIDFGAAADLRIGLNYVPNQYLLDPRYAPPQQYIMSKQTPRAPPAPVAALLSPVLWRLNTPDRFDMYSVGVVLLQMAFPVLRQDNTLVQFNKLLGEQYGWNLQAWRKAMERRGERAYAEGFAMLDADGGAGWDLLCQLIRYDPGSRLSASAALAHPWFGQLNPATVMTSTVASVGTVLSKVTESVDDGWLERQITRNGTREAGGFTEAYLTEEGFTEEARRREDELPANLANTSGTIAWWQGRQAEMQQRLKERRAALGRVGQTISEMTGSSYKPAKPSAPKPSANGNGKPSGVGKAKAAAGGSGSGAGGSGSGDSSSSGSGNGKASAPRLKLPGMFADLVKAK